MKTTYNELNLSDLTSNFNSWWSFISDFVVQGWKQDYRASWSVEFELFPIEYSEASPDIHAMIYASVRNIPWISLTNRKKLIRTCRCPRIAKKNHRGDASAGVRWNHMPCSCGCATWGMIPYNDYLSDTRSTHSKSII